MIFPPDMHARLCKVHNSKVGHWGLDICKRRLREVHQRQGERDITDRMISELIRQCPACQVMSRMQHQIKAHRFTCASYNPFEVLHLDHIGPLTKDAHGNDYILVIIDAFSRWVELFPTQSTTATETASMILNHVGRFGSPEVIHTDQGPAFHIEPTPMLTMFYMSFSTTARDQLLEYVALNNLLPRHIQARRMVSQSALIKKCYDIFVHYSLIAPCTISDHLNSSQQSSTS